MRFNLSYNNYLYLIYLLLFNCIMYYCFYDMLLGFIVDVFNTGDNVCLLFERFNKVVKKKSMA